MNVLLRIRSFLIRIVPGDKEQEQETCCTLSCKLVISLYLGLVLEPSFSLLVSTAVMATSPQNETNMVAHRVTVIVF